MADLKTILLVEDDALDADMTLRTLKSIPLANPIVWLETGKEFLDYLDTHGTQHLALAILDLKMPLITGLEALQHIRAYPEKYGHFPIVVLTSSKDQPEVAACYSLGVNAFVSKPVTQIGFQQAVKALGMFWGLINVTP